MRVSVYLFVHVYTTLFPSWSNNNKKTINWPENGRDAANRWQRRFWPVAVDEVAQPDVGLSAKQALPLFLQITWDQSGQMSGRSCFQRGMVDSCDPPSAARLRLSAAQASSIGLGGTYHPNHQVQRPGRFFDAEPGAWRLLYSSAPLSPSSHNLSSF